MAIDDYRYGESPTTPARDAAAVSPSDSVELTAIPKALFIGTGGNLSVKFPGNATAVVFKNLANGQIIDICPQYVMSTSTTATDIVALL